MDYAIKLVVLSAATLAALAVGVSVLAMYRLVEPRRLAIISLVSAAIAATVYPFGTGLGQIPSCVVSCVPFLAVTAAAAGIACLALTRRSEHPGAWGPRDRRCGGRNRRFGDDGSVLVRRGLRCACPHLRHALTVLAAKAPFGLGTEPGSKPCRTRLRFIIPLLRADRTLLRAHYPLPDCPKEMAKTE